MTELDTIFELRSSHPQCCTIADQIRRCDHFPFTDIITFSNAVLLEATRSTLIPPLSLKMDAPQSVSSINVIPRIKLHDRSWFALGSDEAKQQFRFLDLPAEIRNIIYDLWIPNVLHVSLGYKGIRLQHFAETSQGLYFQSISIHPFFLNKQFYQEFCHALFARAIWSFSSADLLRRFFQRLPKPIIGRIRHISMRLNVIVNNDASMPTGDSSDRLAIHALHFTQRHLRKMKDLQTLVININLWDSRRCSWHASMRDNGVADRLAANCIADFTWEGLQTRIPFAASNLTQDFLGTLKKRCGEANVKVVPKHKDRYAGQMVDVVISQCKVVDQMSVQGLLTWEPGRYCS